MPTIPSGARFERVNRYSTSKRMFGSGIAFSALRTGDSQYRKVYNFGFRKTIVLLSPPSAICPYASRAGVPMSNQEFS